VVSREGAIYVIPVRPDFFQQLQKIGETTIKDVDRLIEQFEKILTDQNVQALSEILINIETMTVSLNNTPTSLESTFKKLPHLVDLFDDAAAQVTVLAKDANETIDIFNAPQGPMKQAAKSLERMQQIASQLQGSTLPEINQLAATLNMAAQAFMQIVRELKQSPQSIIYGSPQVTPGPGEAGFAGFNQ